MRTALVLIALLAAGTTLAQQKSGEVWKWVDKDGITHYSDQPGPPGSTKVDLRLQTYSPSPSASASTPAPESPRGRNADAADYYQRLVITSPSAESTSQENTVSISAGLSPSLRAGHTVRFELDGQPQGPGNSNTLNITVREVPRGAHTVRASVLAENGAVLIQSDPVTFYIQQPSLLSPARKR